nr:cytochrome P450 [Tanacetum cinerariifolium]
MDEQTLRGWLEDQQDQAETLAQEQVAAFQLQFDVLRVELQAATRGLLQGRQGGGDDQENKISVEEVVGGGETLEVGEDDDSGNAATDGGDDAILSEDISILNSLIGHGSQRSSQLWGTIGTTDIQVLIDELGDKEFQYYVYTIYVLIMFLKRLNDKYIKKNKMKVAMQRRIGIPKLRVFFKTSP